MHPKFDRVTIVFTVADIDRTRKFYQDHLGLAFERIESEPEGAFLSTRIGSETDLLVFKGQPKPGNTPGIVFSGFHEYPGASVGTMKRVIPLCFLAFGSVRAASQM